MDFTYVRFVLVLLDSVLLGDLISVLCSYCNDYSYLLVETYQAVY